MSAFPPDRSRRAFPVLLALLVVVVACIAAAAWFFRPRFESEPPVVRLVPDTGVLGL